MRPGPPKPRKTKPSSRRSAKAVIGWSEYVDFVDWHIKGIHAKVDTGARTSALHVEDLRLLDNGEVEFRVVLSRKEGGRRVTIVAPVLRWARVRSSTGHYTRRCFVRTRVRIGPVEKEIELSLISREKMLYRMLLGRQALKRDFVVDVSKRQTLGDKSKRKKMK